MLTCCPTLLTTPVCLQAKPQSHAGRGAAATVTACFVSGRLFGAVPPVPDRNSRLLPAAACSVRSSGLRVTLKAAARSDHSTKHKGHSGPRMHSALYSTLLRPMHEQGCSWHASDIEGIFKLNVAHSLLVYRFQNPAFQQTPT